ncbi:hypothetical protein [Halovenus sp. HT40]|uniref:hypothetical protein n=1 Tax=Halovenus sp. HT40 TaxID=3126691 RepID=UPI00300F43C3
MSSTPQRESKSIYEWLSCPECGSRDVVRGPRFDDGSVELRCDDCELTARVGL